MPFVFFARNPIFYICGYFESRRLLGDLGLHGNIVYGLFPPLAIIVPMLVFQ